MMRRPMVALLLCMLLASSVVNAAPSGALPFEFDPNLDNEASLQRGAKLFMNYCSGCHSLQYMRYQTIADDLGIPEEIVENNLMMTRGQIRDAIDGTMPPASEDWFGVAPPDLSLTARVHGADWLYSFLLSFYLDDSRPSGVNNLVMDNTAMPAVLWPLQGFQALNEDGGEGSEGSHAANLEVVKQGSMNQAEFRQATADLVNFLVYVGEPMKLTRYSLGIKVILFLLLFTGMAYLLKREYWRDVH